MPENKNNVLFQAKRANAYATLKSMVRRGAIDSKEHYRLWLGLLQAKGHSDLDRAVAKILTVYRERGGRVNG